MVRTPGTRYEGIGVREEGVFVPCSFGRSGLVPFVFLWTASVDWRGWDGGREVNECVEQEEEKKRKELEKRVIYRPDMGST